MSIINQVVKGGGITPTGSISITNNGTYDVTDKATAVVNVPTTVPAHYIEKTVDANGKLINSSTIINMSGITDVGNYVLYYAYYLNTAISGAVDMSDLTTLSGSNACQSAFYGCSGLTSANLSSLTTISGTYACDSMFTSCGLTSADLPSLTTISVTYACNSMFSNCNRLLSIKMNKLNVITQQLCPAYAAILGNCQRLESVELGGLTASTFASRTDQIAYLFNNATGSKAPNGCTVHFPSNFDPSDPNHTFDASTLTGYPTFGGNASYIHVAFDLPATELKE